MSGYTKTITIDKKVPISQERKSEAHEKLNEKYKEESKLVKGIFKNLECSGGKVEFPYKKYPQEEVTIFTFEDGKTYDIPLGLARHINQNCRLPPHVRIKNLDGDDVITKDMSKGQQRYEFISTEYM